MDWIKPPYCALLYGLLFSAAVATSQEEGSFNMSEENPMLSGMSQPCPPNREPVKLILMSSEAGVREAIHQLHNLRFREATTWSPLLPTPEPGIVMSINTHYRVTH